MSVTTDRDGLTSGYASLGQRTRAYVSKGWQRGSGWYAALGQVNGSGKTQSAALDDLAQKVIKACETAYDKGYLVIHEDGVMTYCCWFGDGVMQVRIREGRTSGSTMSDWKSPEEAAQDATKESCGGPGTIIRL
jgi:hypothetical protein